MISKLKIRMESRWGGDLVDSELYESTGRHWLSSDKRTPYHFIDSVCNGTGNAAKEMICGGKDEE